MTSPEIDRQQSFDFGLRSPHFNGPAYNPEFDQDRLTGQIKRIYDLMRDGEWRTMREIAAVTGDPEASISAQLRHLRKVRFGSHTVNRRSRGDRASGLWEYQVASQDRWRKETNGHEGQKSNSGNGYGGHAAGTGGTSAQF